MESSFNRDRREARATRSWRANVRRHSRWRGAASAASRCSSAASMAIARSAAPSIGAIDRQHHARLRLSPSRWAILPSLRSLTIAGVNRVAGWRWLDSRKEVAEPLLEVGPRLGAHHAQRLDQRRRQEFVAARLPRLAIAIAAEPVGGAHADRGFEVRVELPRPFAREAQSERRVEMGAGADRVGQVGEIMLKPRRRRRAPAAQARSPIDDRRCRDASRCSASSQPQP